MSQHNQGSMGVGVPDIGRQSCAKHGSMRKCGLPKRLELVQPGKYGEGTVHAGRYEVGCVYVRCGQRGPGGWAGAECPGGWLRLAR